MAVVRNDAIHKVCSERSAKLCVCGIRNVTNFTMGTKRRGSVSDCQNSWKLESRLALRFEERVMFN